MMSTCSPMHHPPTVRTCREARAHNHTGSMAPQHHTCMSPACGGCRAYIGRLSVYVVGVGERVSHHELEQASSVGIYMLLASDIRGSWFHTRGARGLHSHSMAPHHYTTTPWRHGTTQAHRVLPEADRYPELAARPTTCCQRLPVSNRHHSYEVLLEAGSYLRLKVATTPATCCRSLAVYPEPASTWCQRLGVTLKSTRRHGHDVLLEACNYPGLAGMFTT